MQIQFSLRKTEIRSSSSALLLPKNTRFFPLFEEISGFKTDIDRLKAILKDIKKNKDRVTIKRNSEAFL